MSRRIADVFQEAVERQLADAERERLANLPTDSDWQEFLEAARGLLDFDTEIKRGKRQARSELIRGNIDAPRERDNLLAELQNGLQRVVSESLLDDLAAGDTVAGYRILMASLISKSPLLTQDRRVLLEATRHLYVWWQRAETARFKKNGASRPRSGAVIQRQAVKIKRVQDAATAWRKRNPRGTKSAFARWFFDQNRKQRIGEWPNKDALRAWIHSHHIEV